MRKKITINESVLSEIISEAVKRVLNEWRENGESGMMPGREVSITAINNMIDYCNTWSPERGVLQMDGDTFSEDFKHIYRTYVYRKDLGSWIYIGFCEKYSLEPKTPRNQARRSWR